MNFRYPGPQSFTEEDEGLFFGRKRETKALYDLIAVQPLVVLFSKSGMGKTSLLQAGIMPRLRFTEYDPIIIRLHDTQVAPEQQALRKLAADARPDSTLWSEIIRYNEEQNGTPLLIFDQFEEVFTLYSDQQRAAFVRQLADVINGKLPDALRQQIRDGISAGTMDMAAIAALEKVPKVKIVLSIRSDMLHYLHLLSPEIPTILRNRFELLGLQPDQAREAIISPAAQAQELGDYASPVFEYSEEAATQMINFLSRKQQTWHLNARLEPEIESFQLQLLCEHIEKKVTGLAGAGSDKILVTAAFYGGEAGIENVLANFYENTLSKIPDPQAQHLARRLVEDHLIINQRRVSVDGTTISLTYGVPETVLEKLVEARLLRRDSRETGDYYELSHDTLLPPIIRSKEIFDKSEDQRRAREASELARRETRKRQQAVFVAVLAVLASIIAFWQYLAAEQAKLDVYKNALRAQREFAKVLKVEGKYPEALKQLDDIIGFVADLDPAVRDTIVRMRGDWELVARFMGRGDSLVQSGNLYEALNEFEQAYQISPDTRIENIRRQTTAELENRFADYTFRAERQFKAGQYQLAVDNYNNALKLKPTDQNVQQMLKAARERLPLDK